MSEKGESPLNVAPHISVLLMAFRLHQRSKPNPKCIILKIKFEGSILNCALEVLGLGNIIRFSKTIFIFTSRWRMNATLLYKRFQTFVSGVETQQASKKKKKSFFLF